MKELQGKIKHHFLLATYIIVLSFMLLNLKEVITFFKSILNIISPFTTAIVIAFILNIPMVLFEKKLFAFLDRSKNYSLKKLKRPLSILTTFVVVFSLLTGLVLFVIPQLTQSVSTLMTGIPDYLKSLEAFLNRYMSSSDLLNRINTELMIIWKDLLKWGSQLLGVSLSSLFTITLDFTNTLINFTLSLVLAIYMLASKEKLIAQIKKCLSAFFKDSVTEKILYVGDLANITFHHFVAGQFTEALIIGSLCFIGMSFLSMPYALLISVIVAVTSLIPVFGAFIGTVPGTFIIFMISPLQALWFIVFIVVLQQLEGNLIYPRVVGNSIGLSAIWVMLAMIIGGSTFGIMGMLFGIPLFSIFYQLFRLLVEHKLATKQH